MIVMYVYKLSNMVYIFSCTHFYNWLFLIAPNKMLTFVKMGEQTSPLLLHGEKELL